MTGAQLRRVGYSQIGAAVTDLASQKAQPTVISFDVFDTLVRRRCTKRAVLDRASTELIRRAETLGAKPAAAVMAARYAITSHLCHAAEERGSDPEYSIDDLYEPLIERVFGCALNPVARAELAAQMVTYEVGLECQACVPIEPMRDTLATLRTAGHRLIFVSDMYLGTANVTKVLKSCGYGELFEAGYTSATDGWYKATGSMFKHVMAAEDLTPSQLVHVGDHPQADVAAPIKLGIDSIHIVDRTLDQARLDDARVDDYDMALALDQWVRQDTNHLNGSNKSVESDESSISAGQTSRSATYSLESYGRTVVGPIFGAFVHAVRESAIADGVDHLYFLSRDGFLPLRMYGAAADHSCLPAPPASYLVLSRLQTIRALSRHNLSLKAVMAARNQLVPQERTIANTLGMLGIDLDLVGDVCHRYEIDAQAVFDDAMLQHPRFLSVLDDRQLDRAAADAGNASYELLIDYLGEAGYFTHDRIGLVDIGWGGTIQDQLHEVVSDRPDAPLICGYYYGGNRSMFERRTADNRMSPMISAAFNPLGGMPLGNTATFAAIGMIEELARAPHGTCTGLQREQNGTIAPTLKPDDQRQAESEGEAMLSRIQAGALSIADTYFQGIDVLEVTPKGTKALAYTALQRLVYFPQPAEIEWWRTLTHTNDIGGIFEITEQLVPPAEPWHQRFRNWRIKTRASMWTHGAARYLLGPLATLGYMVPWTLSYARNVQLPLNGLAAKVDLQQPRLRRRSATDLAASLASHPVVDDASTQVYRAAIARSDALAAQPLPISLGSIPTGKVSPLVRPSHSLSMAVVLSLTHRAPPRWRGGVLPYDDALPVGIVVRRGIIGALAVRLQRLFDRQDRLSRLIERVIRRALRL